MNPFWFEHLVNWLCFVAWDFLIATPLVLGDSALVADIP